MRVRRLALVVVLMTIVSSSPIRAGSAVRVVPATTSLKACLAKNSSLRVLMLVDESKSLKELGKGANKVPGNDPMDMRVPALASVVRVLNSAVESSSASAQRGQVPLKVAIAIAGFGKSYERRLPFTALNDNSVGRVIRVLESQADRDTDLSTRYDVALTESLKEFERDAGDGASCRLLIWFSDGQHDSNNEPGYSSTEKGEIEKSLCGANGTVDGLRASGVTIVAAGLNSNERELDLMRLIAAGGEGYSFNESSGRPGRVSVAVENCGEIVPDGRFALAQNADDIVDSLFEVLVGVTGIPDPDNPLEDPTPGTEEQCGSAVEDEPCFTQSFVVDDSIAAFQVLVERPSEFVTVILTSAESQEVTVLDGNGPSVDQAKNVIETTVVSAKKATISVTKKKENPILGEWQLAFYGPEAGASKSSITFTGSMQAELLDADGQPIDVKEFRIGRFEANSLQVLLDWDRSASPVQPSALNVDIKIESGDSESPIQAAKKSASRLTYEISASELETVLQSEALKRASAVNLVVRPTAEVKGIRFRSGDPVNIDFGEFSFVASISNGEGLPTFVSLGSLAGLEFEGTPKQKLDLIFRGPDSGDGFVTFSDFTEPEGSINFELIATRQPCTTPQKQVVTCIVELIPDDEAVDRFTGQLVAEYSAVDGVRSSPVEGVIDIPVTTYLRPRLWVGWLAASTLLALFVLVQGVIRLGLAVLLSKFSALAPTARRVRLRASVDSSGSVSVVAPVGELPAGDDGFAFENAESAPSFNLFGYQFDCPYWRTFFRSTTVPLGLVSAGGVHVVGSQGFVVEKRSGETSVGQVALSLRSQWIVGVRDEAMSRLIDGPGPVEAEIVAFLEPYEQQTRAEQISALSFTIASSSFSNHLTSLLKTIRESAKDSADMESDSRTKAEVTGEPGLIQNSSMDFFGGGSTQQHQPEPQSLTQVDGSARGRRKRFGREAESGTATESQSSPNKEEEWDPFA